ncbi:hypothetical protein GCM10028796_31070 [Ramlibacter monticola]|uniref:Uncharacterized protein n=1 Tax=Ramlibacter monticola TaxID=1926872 RepID=A0A937CWI8_9BURK|nr:hypothetical protein [Ramlibacter monticola]MBL0394758.1 hypothetical protein [Ramlibacter monticola]
MTWEGAMREGASNRNAAFRRRGGAAARRLAGAVLALGVAPAFALDPRENAVEAALADGMTTAFGVAASSGAINPLGGLLTIATKAVTFHHASTLPETEQPAAYSAASAMWLGSAVSNVCITVVFLTGGGLAPACLALGAAWGLKTWDDTEHERRFWERCAILRQFAVQQDVQCVYAPPAKDAATELAATQDAPQDSAWREPLPPVAAPRPAVAKQAAPRQVPAKSPAAKSARRQKPASPVPEPTLEPVPPPPAPAPEPLLATSREIEAP